MDCVSDTTTTCVLPASAGAPARPALIIVDDDESVRALVVHYLSKRGFDVTAFSDGKAALAWLEHNACAVVITDILMRETDGLEVIRHLRRTRPALKVIVVSGGDSRGNSYLKAARLLGAANVMSKPFSLADLDAAVRSAFDPGLPPAGSLTPSA